jgi:hypothetical protein
MSRAAGEKPKRAPARPTARTDDARPPDGKRQPKIATTTSSKRATKAASTEPEAIKSGGKRLRQGIEQFPIQILVPGETRDALRRRSEDTGASIRHIILRSLAADGIPVPGRSKKGS